MEINVIPALSATRDEIWYSVKLIRETEKAILFEFLNCKDPLRPTRFWAAKKIIRGLAILESTGDLHVQLPDWFNFARSIDRRHYL